MITYRTFGTMEADMLNPETVFLITGAALGVGRATARLVVDRGHRVVACDRLEGPLEELAGELGERALAVHFDIRDAAGWEHAFDRAEGEFGGVDVVVNNAAVLHSGLAHQQPWEDLQDTVEVNLLGVMKGIRAAVPRLMARGGGHIVTVGSFLSYIPMPGLAAYTATKHGVRAFVGCCAAELREESVSFSLVCPGAIDTPMLASQVDDDAVPLSFADEPLPPERVAEAIYRAAMDRPDELLVPAFRGRTLKLASLFPGVLRSMIPGAEKKGRERQAALRKSR
jgi:short-subunit dehydrogenase